MGKIGFIDYKGFKILLFDFSYLNNSKEILEFIKEAGLIARKQVLKSVLVVTDVTEAHYNIEVTQAMKELAKGNAPYIKASAVVGVTGLKKIHINNKVILNFDFWAELRNLGGRYRIS